MSSNNILQLKDFLSDIFKNILPELSKFNDISSRNINSKLASILPPFIKSSSNIKVDNCTPRIFNKNEKSREPYAVMIEGKINQTSFTLYICAKYGDINSNSSNDIIKYGNILRFYINCEDQKLTEKTVFDSNIILRRRRNDEIITYAIFVLDKEKDQHNLFFLEEMEKVSINAVNDYLQNKYLPELCSKPKNYEEFMKVFIDASIRTQTTIMKKATIEKKRFEELRELFL